MKRIVIALLAVVVSLALGAGLGLGGSDLYKAKTKRKLNKLKIKMVQAGVLDKDSELTVGKVIKMLRHDDQHIQRISAYALGDLGDTRAILPLVDTLGANDPVLRRIAAAALGKMNAKLAVYPLILVARDTGEKKEVRCTAICSLVRIGDTNGLRALSGLVDRGISIGPHCKSKHPEIFIASR